jgi:two-component system phosphate regulon sensor histidine kinase PhoR
VTDLDVAVGALGALLGAVVTYAAVRLGDGNSASPAREMPAPRESDDARVARLVGALPFAAFTIDGKLRVRVFNAAAAALFGVDSARAVGRALIEVIPSVDLERMLAIALAGETTAGDVIFGSGGRERYIGVTAQPYEGGAMAIASDRTTYLAVERARRDFFSDVSHELRTPLSAMKLMLETVMVSDDDTEARTLFLPQVAGEVERMIRLVQDLLELARSDAGAMPVRRERFDLTEVATSTVNSFAQRADGLGVELDLEAPVAIDVDADRGSLVQVTMNLVDNALRHTPAAGRVTVELSRDGATRCCACATRGSASRLPTWAHLRALLRRRPFAFARTRRHRTRPRDRQAARRSAGRIADRGVRLRPRRDVHGAAPGRR